MKMNKRQRLRLEARAAVLKALAHPIRLFIVEELNRESRCVRELTDMVGLDISTVSRHLAVLKNAGLVDIEKNSNVSLTFYDPEHLMQVVMQAQASLVSEDERKQQWDSATDSSLRQYLAPFAPGKECSFSSCNLPDSARNRIPTRYELAEGFRHFRVVECLVTEIDIVVLRRVGNFRARFTKYDSAWQATWLQP